MNIYRPISELRYRIFRNIRKRYKATLTSFLYKNCGFDTEQYGPQKESKNRYVVVLFVDLQKAFDIVKVQLLLHKLCNMVFRDMCHNSENRKHYILLIGRVRWELPNIRFWGPYNIYCIWTDWNLSN